jgi:type I restriction enzyme R subunit
LLLICGSGLPGHSPRPDLVNKKTLTEADIHTKFITPAIEAAGWDKLTQMREETFFTAGRIIVSGKLVARGKG